MMMTSPSNLDLDVSRHITICSGDDALSRQWVDLQARIATERSIGGVTPATMREYKRLKAESRVFIFQQRTAPEVDAVFGF